MVERQQERWEYNNCERILQLFSFFLEDGDIAEFWMVDNICIIVKYYCLLKDGD